MRLKLLSLLFGSALAVVAGIAGLLTLHAEASGEAAGVWRGAGHIIAGHKLKWVTQTSTADVEFWFALDGSGNAVGYGIVRYGLFLDDSRLRGLLACGERNRQLSTRACPRHRFSSRHEQHFRVQMVGSPAGAARQAVGLRTIISVYDVKDFMTGARTQRCVNHLVICRFARQLRDEQRNWSAVQDAAKPFLVLFKGVPATETYEQPQDRRLALTKHILHYNLWLYLVADPSGQMVAETVINNIADAIDAAMQSPLFPGAR